jgi:DNA-binding NarL/FixJ family response regulator
MRTALRTCLDAEPDIDVVGEAADGMEAVEMAQQLQPDVVVMDLRMPNLDGVTATARLTSAQNGMPIKVLVMTSFDLDEYVVEALRAGASGFILKDATSEELLHAVRVVAAGEALLAPSVTRRLLTRYAHRLPAPARGNPDVVQNLTARELEVLQLVARGLSNQQIATALHVAESSVKTHVGHLLAKLDLADRIHLVIFCYESGLVQPAVI